MGERKISVVIAGKNSEKYIETCMDSLVTQTLKEFEVIFVDDKSSDNTKNLVRSYCAKLENLTILDGAGIGVAAARNIGNANACSPYIAVLDADDTYLPNALVEFIKTFESDPNIDVIFSDCFISDSKMRYKIRKKYKDLPSDTSTFVRYILGSFFVAFKHSSVAYKKSVHLNCGGYSENLKKQVDVDFFIKAKLSKSVFFHLSLPLCIYRKHAEQMSRLRLKNFKNWSALIDKYEKNIFWKALLKLSRGLSEALKSLTSG